MSSEVIYNRTLSPIYCFCPSLQVGQSQLRTHQSVWVELGHTTRMNAAVFFPPCPLSSAKLNLFRADCVVHPSGLARHGPNARSLEACLGLRLGCLLIAYATIVIPSHKSVRVKNIPEMQIVPESNKIFQNMIKLSQNRKCSRTNKNIF